VGSKLTGVVFWIVLGVVLLGLVVLVLTLGSVLGRLAGLQRATRRLLLRQEQAARVSVKGQALQERLLVLQRQAEVAEQRLAALAARRQA